MKTTITKIGFNPDKRQVDFSVKITGARGSETFEFHSGILGSQRPGAESYIDARIKAVYRTRGVKDALQSIRRGAKMIESNPNVIAAYSLLAECCQPTIQDIFPCLWMDRQSGQLSFKDFCDEFGYNSDSIKDNAVYQECVLTRNKLDRILSDDELSEIQKIAEENQ